MEVKGTKEAANFDVKVRIEEMERKSQMTIVGFGIQLTTKPAILKLEVGGTATLTGKDEDIRKMLEINPETKMPRVLPRIYQHAFTSMYLLATVLDLPPPPHDLLSSDKEGTPPEGVNVEIATEKPETKDSDGVTIQADTRSAGNSEDKATTKQT